MHRRTDVPAAHGRDMAPGSWPDGSRLGDLLRSAVAHMQVESTANRTAAAWRAGTVVAATVLVVLATLLAVGIADASAGPCTQQIADLKKAMATSPSMGAATTGVISGTVNRTNGGASEANTARDASTNSGKAESRGVGAGGTKDVSAAAGQIATSPEDVRRQQQGMPTQAQAPNVKDDAADNGTEAKNKLQAATDLDAKGDAGCSGPLDEAKKLSGQNG